ncbi:MAG: bifunctional 5,10-methylenetetrahydrofolate dehydrogenase/5,10-methenyltetrahydrofolate cyclohydrolase [Patescibacteria group bacterium]
MVHLIDGKVLAKVREEELKLEISSLGYTPKVASIVIGSDAPSLLYTKMKQKKATDVGINFEPKYFSSDTPYNELVNFIRKLNEDLEVNGIMIQLPIPDEFLKGKDWREILAEIKIEKDVDGLRYPDSKFLPATARAVLSILDDEKIEVKNKKVIVLGRSNLVGKPVADELINRGANVSVVHSQTPNPKEITLAADIIISAVGKPHLVKGDWIKNGTVVIDVGTSEDKETGKIVGDVDFEEAKLRASKITPVPGGVGPMTVISLMENVLESAKGRN